MTEWKHDNLAYDLALFKRSDKRMVWCDMQLGPSGSPRPDVYTIEKSYSKPDPTAYEIKVTRSDFLADVTAGKYQSYFRYAGRVIFAVPDGLISKEEVPTGCGLIVRKAATWRMARRATANQVEIPSSAMMKLLIDGVNRTVLERRAEPRSADAWRLAKSGRLALGQDVAEAIRSVDNMRGRLRAVAAELEAEEIKLRDMRQAASSIKREARERGEKQAEEMQQKAKDAICEIGEAVGIKGATLADIRWRARDLAEKISKDAEVSALRKQIGLIRGALKAADETPVANVLRTDLSA